VDDGEPAFEAVPLEVIQGMIRQLPDGYRTVFNLFVFEDKSHKEIASLLGIKENSSASQLFHAKALLARWIKDYIKLKDNG
jgi:RNA polymerase sigma-70 factor (ECF subfamily)